MSSLGKVSGHQTMDMRAAVYEGAGSVSLQEIPRPAGNAGTGSLLVEGCGICIADGEAVRGLGGPNHHFPIVLGHEIVGRLTDVGEEVPDEICRFLGQRVLLNDSRPCGECEFCTQGSGRFCKAPHYGHIPGISPTGSWGGYTEMVTVDSHSTLCPIAEDVPIALATFAYPLASGLEWVNRLASLRPGESVAVVGASRIGVAVVAAASLGSPSRITLFGASDAEAARDAADRLGAHIAAGFSDYESPFDVVIVVTEATAEEAMQGLALAAPMGRVVLASTSTSTFPLQPESVRRRGLLVRGGRAHTIESLQNAVEAVSTRPDWLEPTFVETYPLEEAAAALQDLHDAAGNPRGVHALVSVPQ